MSDQIKVGQKAPVWKEDANPEIQVKTGYKGQFGGPNVPGQMAGLYTALGGVDQIVKTLGADIPIDDIMTRFFEYADCYAGKFVEVTHNESFLYYANEIFMLTYMLDEVYLYKQILLDEHSYFGQEVSCYYPLTKMSKITNQYGQHQFLNLITNNYIELRLDEVVRFKWGGMNSSRMKSWLSDVRNILQNEARIKWSWQLAMKKIRVSAIGSTQRDVEDTIVQMRTLNPFVCDKPNSQGSEEFDPIVYTTYTEVDQLLVGHYRYVDRVLHRHGLVSNINRKNERLTAGEQITYTQSIADKDQLTENSLRIVEANVLRLWGDTLKFVLNRPDNQVTGSQNRPDSTHESDTTSDEQ